MTASATTSAEQPRKGVDHKTSRLGVVFAQALIGAAGKEADSVIGELDALVNDVLDRHPELETALGSNLISNEDKYKIVDHAFTGRVSTTLSNFLKVVVEHGRGEVLRAVQEAAHDLLDAAHRRVRVQVTTATPLDDASARQIVDTLRHLTNQEPVLERQVDPRVIGGAVFRIGDTVYDGSIANQLERMRTQLLNRSVHEIQSGRDRLSPSEGN